MQQKANVNRTMCSLLRQAVVWRHIKMQKGRPFGVKAWCTRFWCKAAGISYKRQNVPRVAEVGVRVEGHRVGLTRCFLILMKWILCQILTKRFQYFPKHNQRCWRHQPLMPKGSHIHRNRNRHLKSRADPTEMNSLKTQFWYDLLII